MEELTQEEKAVQSRERIGRERRYIGKIKNDVDEKLYDLLLVHLSDVHKKVKPYGIFNYETKEKVKNGRFLTKQLDRAIKDIYHSINYYNKLRYYRYLLIICNAVLKYDVNRQDLKDLKMEIVQDYIHSEESLGELIPLNYQINELRITYDTSYISFLVTKFIEDGLFQKALYCLIALEMIEPDHENIDKLRKTIQANIISAEPEYMEFHRPEDETLYLDSNVLIEWVNFRANHSDKEEVAYYLMNKYGKNNRLVISSTVISEVETHLNYRYSQINKQFPREEKARAKELCENLKKSFEDIISMNRAPDVELSEEVMGELKEFYSKYLNLLEGILMSKIDNKMISYRLRKLAQRKNLLPEKGDLKLLAECITLSKDTEVSILSKDKDLTLFAGEIFKNFGIKVYRY